MVPAAARGGAGAELCRCGAVRRSAAGGRPSRSSPGPGPGRSSLGASRGAAGPCSAAAAASLPQRAPLPSAAAAGLFSDLYGPGRVPLSSGARSPIAAEPLGTAGFSPQSRRSAPRTRGPTWPRGAARRGTAPVRPRCRGGGGGGLRASRPRRRPPALPGPAARSCPANGCRRARPCPVAVTVQPQHAAAFICLGPGPRSGSKGRLGALLPLVSAVLVVRLGAGLSDRSFFLLQRPPGRQKPRGRDGAGTERGRAGQGPWCPCAPPRGAPAYFARIPEDPIFSFPCSAFRRSLRERRYRSLNCKGAV